MCLYKVCAVEAVPWARSNQPVLQFEGNSCAEYSEECAGEVLVVLDWVAPPGGLVSLRGQGVVLWNKAMSFGNVPEWGSCICCA
jgi:hypothetical protein